MAFLERDDLNSPVCTTASALACDPRVTHAKEVLYNRVNDIDQSMGLHQIYTDAVTRNYDREKERHGTEQDSVLARMREAWNSGDNALVDELSNMFATCGQSAVHLSTFTGRAEFLRGVATGQVSLNMFERHSSFRGSNEGVYGCGVPKEWLREEGGRPNVGGGSVTVQQVVEKLFPGHGGGLINAMAYGPDGAWAAEREVLLKLLKELNDALRTAAGRVVHLPMIIVCAKKWDHTGQAPGIGESEMHQIREYMASKERVRQEMDQCISVMHNQMHHVVEAAFRFVLLRSLPGAVGAARGTLPMRSSDDRVAAVARAHLYLMLAVARHRNIRTVSDEPIFSTEGHGLCLASTRLWACTDWVGFCMMVDVALSAEGGSLGREQAAVSLLPLPSFMLSIDGVTEVPLHSNDAGQIIAQMAIRTESRYGSAPIASFVELHPFNCVRCAQLLRLNWNAYRHLRPSAKTEDISRFSRTHPWKGQPVYISPEEREVATAFYVREYERFMQRSSEFVADSTVLPPLTDSGQASCDDADVPQKPSKVARL